MKVVFENLEKENIKDFFLHFIWFMIYKMWYYIKNYWKNTTKNTSHLLSISFRDLKEYKIKKKYNLNS